MTSPARPTYRVELRTPNSIVCLATNLLCVGNQRALDPFVSKLMLERRSGTLVLVESDSGMVVAKRKLADPLGDCVRSTRSWLVIERQQKTQRLRELLTSEVSCSLAREKPASEKPNAIR